MTEQVPNPIIRSTALRVAPGWEVREYADGTFDAINLHGIGLGPVEDSFGAAVYFARHGEPVMLREARVEVAARAEAA